jgi:hypothetical protein
MYSLPIIDKNINTEWSYLFPITGDKISLHSTVNRQFKMQSILRQLIRHSETS